MLQRLEIKEAAPRQGMCPGLPNFGQGFLLTAQGKHLLDKL